MKYLTLIKTIILCTSLSICVTGTSQRVSLDYISDNYSIEELEEFKTFYINHKRSSMVFFSADYFKEYDYYLSNNYFEKTKSLIILIYRRYNITNSSKLSIDKLIEQVLQPAGKLDNITQDLDKKIYELQKNKLQEKLEETKQKSLDCSSIKTDEFYYLLEDGSKLEVTRTKTKQIEKHKDVTQEFDIFWESGCKYQLVGMKKYTPDFSFDTIDVEILSITDDSYKCVNKLKDLQSYIELELFIKKQ